MTNEQLYMLLRSMLNELDLTMDKMRDLLTKDAGLDAMTPLDDLWQTWNDRVELALGKDKTE